MQRKKRLLVTTDCFAPRWDGIVRFLLETLPNLKEEYDITIIAPDFGPYKGFEFARVIRFPVLKYKFNDIHFVNLHYSEIKEYVKQADLVFNQTIGPIGASAIYAASRLKKPVISYTHSIEWELTTKSVKHFKGFFNIFTRMVTKWIYNKCSLLLVPYMESEEKMQRLGINTKMELVRLGTDTDYFKPPKSKAEAKKKLKLNKDDIIIGFIGRIGREKNLKTLYDAFQKLEKYENVKLLIVGSGIEEEEAIFKNKKNIIFAGPQDTVVPYYQALDIFVLPSLTETSSLSTMEAMACGVPVITTPVGQLKKYVKERENGMFFPFKNSLRLSMKLKLLIKDKDYREWMGRRARKTIEEKFQWKITIDNIKKQLDSVAEKIEVPEEKMKKYEYLPHTADAEFVAYGKTINEAFSNAAEATFGIISETEEIKPKIKKEFKLKAKRLESLLYDFLEELLIYLDTDGWVLSKIDHIKIMQSKEDFKLECVCHGDSYKNYEVHGNIKSVTYNNMQIKQTKNGWSLRVVVDI